MSKLYHVTVLGFLLTSLQITESSYIPYSRTFANNNLSLPDSGAAAGHQNVPKRRLSFYGEPCQNTSDCAPTAGLTCSNSTCLCSSEYIARLNPVKGLVSQTNCVVRADSPCSLAMHPSSPNSIPNNKRTFSSFFWSKLKKNVFFDGDISGDSVCVDHARCIQGFCRCSPDHFRDPHRGLCLKRRSLFQPCDFDSNCKSSEGLVCAGGKCQCRESMVFDRFARKCFIPSDQPCDAYSSEIDMECVRNSECSNSRCVCNSGYTKSSSGNCGVAHGHKCDNKERVCSDNLVCRSGLCQCKYSIHQVYNSTLDFCLSKPGGPCSSSKGESSPQKNPQDDSYPSPTTAIIHQKCVPFSECAPAQENLFEYACKCLDGYAENQVGECVPSYGSACLEDDDCDEVAQLTCLNGRCSCPDEEMLVFDWTRRKCVGNIGSRCKYIQIERLLSMNVDIPTECVEGARCVENVFRLDGRCECNSGWTYSKTAAQCVSQLAASNAVSN